MNTTPEQQPSYSMWEAIYPTLKDIIEKFEKSWCPHEKPGKPGTDYRADVLLDQMRPAVNDVLEDVEKMLPGTLPHCPSMSQKAIMAIRAIDKMTGEDMPMTPLLWRSKLNSLRGELEDFMAVWNTVNIMEHPENHRWFQPKQDEVGSE